MAEAAGVNVAAAEDEFDELSEPRLTPRSAAPAASAAFVPDFATPFARPLTAAAATGPRLRAETTSQCCYYKRFRGRTLPGQLKLGWPWRRRKRGKHDTW